MSCPAREMLDALCAGELEAGEAARLGAHADRCPRCGKRLAWLRRESKAIRAAAADDGGDVERLWPGVEAALRTPRARRRRWVLPGTAAAVAAAAAIAFLPVLRGGDEATPSAESAILAAEHEYGTAIATLEARVERERPGQHSGLGRARRGLLRAKEAAHRDPAARVRLLEGYAAYLKSLRRALMDEAT